MNQDIPEGWEDLAYTDDPAKLRILVKILRNDMKMPIGEIVDLIFEDCYEERDFARLAEKWAQAVDPEWTSEDLKRWAMKRRNLNS